MTRVLIIFLISLLSELAAHAADTETLPEGVRNTQLRYGIVSGLDQTWESDWRLYKLGETKSVPFDATTLAGVNEEARQLVRALDFFGTQGLGSKIFLGTLNVETKPEIRYYAPVAAYGLSETTTIAIGVPIINYKNAIKLSSTGSNLEFYRNQFGGINDELDAALNIDLVKEAEKVIASKGYLPLENRDEDFIGDVQIAILRRLPQLRGWSAMHQLTITLPTGPKENPDDLMALNTTGRFTIDGALTASKTIASNWKVIPYGSFIAGVPDRITKRVPKNENDLIPDSNSKATVWRWLGPSLTMGAELSHDMNYRWSVAAGTETKLKGRDYFFGSARTDLLSKNTDSQVQKVRARLAYSTIEAYKRKEFDLPSSISLQVSDTILGRNIERQLVTELTAMIFF